MMLAFQDLEMFVMAVIWILMRKTMKDFSLKNQKLTVLVVSYASFLPQICLPQNRLSLQTMQILKVFQVVENSNRVMELLKKYR